MAQKHEHKMNKILANIDIFVGTYDSYLLSYKIKTHNEVNLYIFNTIRENIYFYRFSKLCYSVLLTKIPTQVPFGQYMV